MTGPPTSQTDIARLATIVDDFSDALVNHVVQATSFRDLLRAYVSLESDFYPAYWGILTNDEFSGLQPKIYNLKNLLSDLLQKAVADCTDLRGSLDPKAQADALGSLLSRGKADPEEYIFTILENLAPQQRALVLRFLHGTAFSMLEGVYFDEANHQGPYNRAISRVNFFNTQFSFPIFSRDWLDEQYLLELREEFEEDLDAMNNDVANQVLGGIPEEVSKKLWLGDPPEFEFLPLEATMVELETRRAMAFVEMLVNRDRAPLDEYGRATRDLRSFLIGDRLSDVSGEWFKANYVEAVRQLPVSVPVGHREVLYTDGKQCYIVQWPTKLSFYVRSMRQVSWSDILAFHTHPAKWIEDRQVSMDRHSAFARWLERSDDRAQSLARDLSVEHFLEASLEGLRREVLDRIISRDGAELGVQIFIIYGVITQGDQLLLSAGIQDSEIRKVAEAVMLALSEKFAHEALSFLPDESDEEDEADLEGSKLREIDEAIQTGRSRTEELLRAQEEIASEWRQDMQKVLNVLQGEVAIPEKRVLLNELLHEIETQEYDLWRTPNGGRYHRRDCRFIQEQPNRSHLASVEDAEDQSLTACSVCIEQPLGEDVS